ncbi:MAG: 3',5'-cyclic-nucleotide phosphodiesterase [Curvibacter sp.]
MKVRVLGCSGAIARECRTTSFLLDDDLLVDAGTGVGDLTLDEMLAVDHVLLTHSHLDHIAALPLMLDAIAARRSRPLQVHALPGTIAALQTHVFNDVIWPDFTRLPSLEMPFVRLLPVEIGQTLSIGAKRIEVLPAVHTVPAVGYAVSAGPACWVFSGDTGPNPEFWRRVNRLQVSMLVIETAFSSRESQLAQASQHLSPAMLAAELDGIAPGSNYPIYITHTKPAETELIMSEIRALGASGPSGSRRSHDIRWLQAGQEFDL